MKTFILYILLILILILLELELFARSIVVTTIASTRTMLSGNATHAANSHAVVTTGWTDYANAYDLVSDDDYATAAVAKNSTISGDFGFAVFTDGEIPVTANLISIVATVEWKVSTQDSNVTLGMQIYRDGVAVGSETVVTNEPLSDTTANHTISTGVSIADLKTADLVKVRVRTTRGSSNNACTTSLDYVTLKVYYEY